MDPRVIPLYYISSIAGLIMVAGGILLIYKQKIYIDRESKQVTEVETPIGKFRTNLPALVLFVLGFVPLIYPMVQARKFVQELRIVGDVEADTFPVTVYAVAQLDSLQKSRSFSISVPYLKDVTKDYVVLYVAHNSIGEQLASIGSVKDGEIRLQKVEISNAGEESYIPNPIPPVPAEFMPAGGGAP
ncbi:MAG: hypothetical protein AB7H86_05680 [Blastocatellales bacterium]